MPHFLSVTKRKEQANTIHNNRYDYSLWPDKVQLETRITNICPDHGEFSQPLRNHITKRFGCPKCGRERVKQTWKNTLGVDNPSKSTEVKNKKKQTSLKNYGVEHPRQHEDIIERTKKTNTERYGGVAPACSKIVREKAVITNMKRYSREHSSQSKISDESITLLNNKQWLFEQHHELNKPLTEILQSFPDITYKTLHNYFLRHDIKIKQFFQSTGEKELGDFIESLGLKIERNNRTIISPYEIDIYLPEYQIAIEYNGDYWHGDDFPDQQRRDQQKQMLCEQNDITLLTIWESVWLTEKEIIKQDFSILLLDK